MGFFANIGAVLLKIKGAVMATTATKVATVAVATVIVIGGTAAAVQTEVFASPEKKVEHALESLTENEEGAFGALLGIRDFFGKVARKGMDAGLEVKLQDVPMDALGLSGISIPNIGMEFAYRFDAKKEQSEMVAGAKVANTTLLSATVYTDKEKLMASVPQLFEGYIGANYADSEFLEQLKNSELATMLGEEFTAALETFSESMQNPENQKETLEQIADYLVTLKKSKKELFAAMEAEADGEAKVLVNGETVACKVYKATFGPAEVEAFVNVLIDETVALFDSYMQENSESTGAEAVEERNAQMDAMLQELEAFQEELKGEITETALEIYLKGKRLVMADLTVKLKENSVNLNVLFGTEGNRYDNMHLSVDVTEDGATACIFELVHETKDTEELFSSEWNVLVEEEEVFGCVFQYEKTEGDFSIRVLLPMEEFELALEGVLTIPDKGKELAFELNDIRFTEYGETVSLGLQTEVCLKVFDGEITEPEEMKWNVATMGATEWNDITSEVTSNVYSLVMKLLFGN